MDKDGKALSCKDKLATLDDNLAELLEIALDALEDAAVMGVDPETAQRIFVEEIASLQPRFGLPGVALATPRIAMPGMAV